MDENIEVNRDERRSRRKEMAQQENSPDKEWLRRFLQVIHDVQSQR